ncbi:MAG: hypothetical protein HC902_01060 [Calothrix sp. SM1_5_4]|nr:hypothetical protein [Calothrix sp. SM1_5_4]
MKRTQFMAFSLFVLATLTSGSVWALDLCLSDGTTQDDAEQLVALGHDIATDPATQVSSLLNPDMRLETSRLFEFGRISPVDAIL